ncbi:hypothetical protein N1851_023437 [Merluccius polli]|uniref:Uncharacterized protein n=1 Tax=Merluccius polli TaxID=89951 RepID=A0AA47MG61_MERPO|nr:hypothetical protein N1851_023437 [Merluccius polli]
MEAYPECVDAMMGGLSVEKELLQSLARRVEEVEERREQKVLEWPAHLCDQLSDKTYHWCKYTCRLLHPHPRVKMLSDSENGTSAERQKKSGFKGLEAFHPTETRKGGIEVGSERAAKKRRNETQPVFKVSIPLTQGAFVLERSSFSRSNSPAVGTSPGPPPETLAPDPDLEFGPQTVTAFEPPRLPRTIEVRKNIPVVIGRRQEEHGCDWGLPSQESGADAYTAIPSLHSCYPDPPYPEYIADVQTPLIQGDPMPPHAAGLPAGGTGFPGSSFDVAPETLTSWVGPDLHDQDSANSDAQQKPAVLFYFCTPNGQRQP